MALLMDPPPSNTRQRKMPYPTSQRRVKSLLLFAILLAPLLLVVRTAIQLQSLEISTLSDSISNGAFVIALDSPVTKAVVLPAISTERNEWEADPERSPFIHILRQAGYDLKDTSIWNNQTMASLPRWSDIVQFFGAEPKIYGLETCHTFQQQIKNVDRHIGVAGMFNSGTNLLSNLLLSNCENKARIQRRGISATGMVWQVPWGKHVPASYRGNHTTTANPNSRYKRKAPNVSTVLPAVVVRDPYEWMKSMCRQPYSAQFEHTKDHCPNLVPYPSDIQARPRFRHMKYIPVTVSYGSKDLGKFKHESLAHLWNTWYDEYIHADFPRLIVRLEDLWFHAEETITQVCECGGGTMRSDGFVHIAQVANLNPGIETTRNELRGLIGSLIRYGNHTNRRQQYSNVQLQAARDILKHELMNLFEYSYET